MPPFLLVAGALVLVLAHGVHDSCAQSDTHARITDAIEKFEQFDIPATPYTHPERVANIPEAVGILETVVELYEAAANSHDTLIDSAHQILYGYDAIAIQNPLSQQNYGALAFASDHDFSDLFAAFLVCRLEGELDSIDVLLTFALVGSYPSWYMDSISGNRSYLSFEEEERTVSGDVEQTFWPAADVILSHPQISIPKLIDFLKHNDKEEHLRIRAAAFLHEMAPDVLEELVSEVPNPIGLQIVCIQVHDVSWKDARPNVCERIKRLHMKRGTFMERLLRQN